MAMNIVGSPQVGQLKMGTDNKAYMYSHSNSWIELDRHVPTSDVIKNLISEVDFLKTVILRHPELKEIYEQEFIVKKLKGT